MSGVKGRSGPRKKLKTQCDDWIANNPDKVSELLEILYHKGLNGSIEAAIYVIDRVLGRPRQEIDQRIKGHIMSWTAEDYLLISRERQAVKDAETELIEQFSPQREPIEGEFKELDTK